MEHPKNVTLLQQRGLLGMVGSVLAIIFFPLSSDVVEGAGPEAKV